MHMNTIAMNTAHRGGLLAGLWTAVLLTVLSATAPARAERRRPFECQCEAGDRGIAAVLGQKKSAEPDFLPPDQAFRFSALPDGPDSIRLIWGVTDGYYLYRARIKASSDTAQAKLGELALPAGETKIESTSASRRSITTTWWARSPSPDRAPGI